MDHLLGISRGRLEAVCDLRCRIALEIVQPQDFADAAFRTIAAGRSYRVIPWQMGVVAKLLRALPNAVFDSLLAGRPRKHRQGE